MREALVDGHLELAEVRTIVDRVTDAHPDLWGAIEDAIFPKVLELRGGLLRAKVESEVLKADPEAAVKRLRAKRSARDVTIWPAVDASPTWHPRTLGRPGRRGVRQHRRHRPRGEVAGDPRNLGQLRADVAASLLTGMADIIDCSAPAATDNTVEQDRAQGQSEQDETVQGPEGHCAVHRFPDHDLHVSWCECGDCSPTPVASCTVCGGAAVNGTPIHDTAAHHAAECNATEQNAAEDNSTSPSKERPWSSTQSSWGGIRTRSKIQLNMPLTTLMGLSTRPGELGGFGPVITEVARRLVVNNLTSPEARFSVGVTHPVTGRLLHLHPIPARFLRGLQAELVHARDQRCVWTTCRRPAATCHLDHNTEYADGGDTSVDNIAPLCPRHHKAKSERDWKLQQTGPGEHTLTDPFGRQYRSGAPSLTDPAPVTAMAAEDDLPPF